MNSIPIISKKEEGRYLKINTKVPFFKLANISKNNAHRFNKFPDKGGYRLKTKRDNSISRDNSLNRTESMLSLKRKELDTNQSTHKVIVK